VYNCGSRVCKVRFVVFPDIRGRREHVQEDGRVQIRLVERYGLNAARV
jgi:hypothetical protein